jgi:uncharacterized membrane-anchored protein YitT (DUF2179 family)
MTSGYHFFFIPNKIAPGGFSGLGTILYYQFGFPVGAVTLALNVPLFLVAWRQQGIAYTLRSLVATLLFSVLLDILPEVIVTEDLLLASVYGGGLVGVGLGMVVRSGASTGGTDMLANLITKRVPGMSFGVTLFIIEAVIVGLSAVAFGPQSALYAVLVILMTSKLVDAMQEGLNAAKAFFIISNRGNEIASKILTDLERGVTALNGKGMYSGEERVVLLCIIHRAEMGKLKALVRDCDPAAFMIVSDVREALGEGFAQLPQKKEKKTKALRKAKP